MLFIGKPMGRSIMISNARFICLREEENGLWIMEYFRLRPLATLKAGRTRLIT